MSLAQKKTKRERPADGGMVWHHNLCAFECLGCLGFEEVHSRRIRDNPEELRRKLEFFIVDHTECWHFDDPRMAPQARKHRKRKKLNENLAAQRTSWRGR